MADAATPAPRRRRWAWLGVLAGFGLTGGAFAWGAWATATAAPSIDFDGAAALRAAIGAHQPPGEANGWPAVRRTVDAWGALRADAAAWAQAEAAAGRLFDLTPDEVDERVLDPFVLLDPPAAHSMNAVRRARHRATARALERAEALGLDAAMREVAAHDRFVRDDLAPYEPLVGFGLGDLTAFRAIGTLQAGRMRRAAEAGDARAAVEAFRLGCVLGDAVGRQGRLAWLMARTMTSPLLQEARRWATDADAPPDADALLAMLAITDRCGAPPAAAAWVEAERIALRDALQRVYGPDGLFIDSAGGGVGAAGRRPPRLLRDAIGAITTAPRSATETALDDFFTRLRGFASLPGPARRRAMLNSTAWTINDDPLVHQLAPAIGHVFNIDDDEARKLAVTRLVLALELHRRTTGRHPASLAALSMPDGSAPPLDPSAGAPFVYTRLGPGHPSGLSYLVHASGTPIGDADPATALNKE